ncbi:MAG: hypothetical protein PHI97_00280 [Desulfobulbus sp.]|nr:hypothetical protein [Desulfobulbus sp.]
MRLFFLILLSMAVTMVNVCAPARASDPRSHTDLCGFLAGTYTVVGKELDNTQTYLGQVIFRQNGQCLQMERIIGSERVLSEGCIEHALGADAADVLRVRFIRQGKKYEITYLWQSDLDNYARISGYVYQPGIQTDSPGMEVLFINRGNL